MFACPASNCLTTTLDSANDYVAAGVDAVVSILPNYFKLDPAEMQAYFERLADGIKGPLMIYNMPATTGMSLPLDVIDALSQRPNVTGLKDSEGTEGRREAVAKRKEHPQRVLIGLEIDGKEPVGHGACIHSGRAQIGVVTSGCRSPLLQKNIALCRMDVNYSAIGTEVEVGRIDGHQKRIPARVVRFPFYDPEKKKPRS